MSNYTPYYEGGWKNEEEMTTTPICAEALNHMEEGISAAYDTDIGLYPAETASGDVAVIHDGAESIPVRDLSVAIESVQTFNGYDRQWAGGAGKNLLPYPYTETTKTASGITYTVNSDGTVKANGTATANVSLSLGDFTFQSGVSYVLNGCPSGGGNDKYNITISGIGPDIGNGYSWTGDGTSKLIRIWVVQGQTVNNIVFKPMIRKSSETDATYEPYSNICPIRGWDTVKVARTVQNLLPNNYTETVFSRNGITFTVSDDGVVTANGTATAATYFNFSGWDDDNLPFMHRPGLRLRLSGSYPGVITRLQIRPYGSSTTTTIATDTGTGVDFTVPDDVRTYALFINITSGQTVTNATFHPVISVADEGQPTWSPSEAEVEDITLPTTVYGGTLDVTTGVLTVDRASVTLDGSEDEEWIVMATAGIFRNRTITPAIASDAGLVSDEMTVTAYNYNTMKANYPAVSANTGYVYIAISDATTTATQCRAWLASNPAQLVYNLATPQTYTLTPVQVKTLLGENRIYADAGQVTVQYRGEIKQIGVDPTLSVAGMAADAKAVGDAVAGIGAASVPAEVRQAMLTLFQKAAYIETGLADEVAVVQAWASEVTAITISASAISIHGATTNQLSAVTTPAGGAVTWESSNTAVATVSNTGLVTGVSNGTAVITARSGDVSATCTATVSGFATLTGIEAVYTQSGTIYETASLDDLKADLVVTGTYDDSTTETITDYTLSGTLAEGTSTITVSYGGFTDTFSVTVSEYVDPRTLLHEWDFTQGLSDLVGDAADFTLSSATQTSSGITLSEANSYARHANLFARNRTYEVDIASFTDNLSGGHGRLFMPTKNGTNATNGFIYRNTGSWQMYFSSWSGDTVYTTKSLAGKTVVITVDSNGIMKAYIDDVLIATSATAVPSDYNILFLGSNGGNTYRTCVITGLRVYEGVA